MSKQVKVLLSIAVVLLSLSACGGSGSQGSAGAGLAGSGTTTPEQAVPERSKTVNIGWSSKPLSLDPHNHREQGTEVAVRMCYETLIYTDHSGRGYDPLLAESWDIAPDGLSWTFYLREDVFWHNGDPFTADDVVFSVERVVDRKEDLYFMMQYMPDLESAEKIDDYTVKINFSKSFPLAGNGFRTFYIIPKKAYEEYGDDLFHLQYCYGTGPWKMNEWIDGQYVSYTKNENYWNKANYDPYFDEVYIRYTPEPSSAISAHLAGSIEAYISTSGISADLLSLYSEAANKTELVSIDTNTTVWMGLSFGQDSVWADDNFRKAFTLAIDRQLILDNILGGGTVPVGYFHESIIGYDESLGKAEYNPELARQLLASSSYDGRLFEVLITTSMAKGEEIGLAMVDMAKKAGFNMEITLEESSVVTARRAAGEYSAHIGTLSYPDGIPQRQLNRILNDTDKSYYVNEELFGHIRHFNTDMDEDKRFEFAKNANRIITETLPHIALFHLKVVNAVDYGIVGINMYPDGLYNFSYIDWDPPK